MTGANVLISGSYQILNNEILVNARFVNIEKATINSGSAIHFRSNLNDLFDLQEKVADEFNNKFKISLSSEEKQSIRESLHSTSSSKAQELYIKARDKYYIGGFKGTEEVIVLLEETIRLDPNYSLAWALLGESYLKMGKFLARLKDGLYIEADPEKYFQKGKQALEKSLSLSPNFYETYQKLGMGYILSKDYKKAEINLIKALELKPDDVESILSLALLKENPEELFQKAMTIDPYNYLVYENFGSYYFHYFSNNIEYRQKSIPYFLKALELNPNTWAANLLLVQMYIENKDFETAKKYAEIGITQKKDDIFNYLVMTDVYSKSGDASKTRELLEKIDLMIESPLVKAGKIRFMMGDNNFSEAYKLARKSLEKFPEFPDLNYLMAKIYREHFHSCKLAEYNAKLSIQYYDKRQDIYHDNVREKAQKLLNECQAN